MEKSIRKVIYDFTPKSGLICIENTFNGRAVKIEYMKNIYDLAHKYNIPVHLDGARVFNAAVALGIEVSEIAQYADSVSFCLSKGLCCPIVSILVGTKEFITLAKRYRKMIGGTLRQSGVLGGPGIIALTEQRFLLKKDHEFAKKFYTIL